MALLSSACEAVRELKMNRLRRAVAGGDLFARLFIRPGPCRYSEYWIAERPPTDAVDQHGVRHLPGFLVDDHYGAPWGAKCR